MHNDLQPGLKSQILFITYQREITSHLSPGGERLSVASTFCICSYSIFILVSTHKSQLTRNISSCVMGYFTNFHVTDTKNIETQIKSTILLSNPISSLKSTSGPSNYVPRSFRKYLRQLKTKKNLSNNNKQLEINVFKLSGDLFIYNS